jgi:hypothetical protein
MKRLSKDQKQQRADLVTRLNDAAEAVRAALAAVNAEIAGKLNSLSQTRGARGGQTMTNLHGKSIGDVHDVRGSH